jgi:hypothetical protein
VASVRACSLVQRSPTRFVCLILCDLATSKQGVLGPLRAIAPHKNKTFQVYDVTTWAFKKWFLSSVLMLQDRLNLKRLKWSGH